METWKIMVIIFAIGFLTYVIFEIVDVYEGRELCKNHCNGKGYYYLETVDNLCECGDTEGNLLVFSHEQIKGGG